MLRLQTSIRAVILFSLSSLVAFPLSAQATPEYTVTDLGTLGGRDSHARAINASGQIVGESFTDNSVIHAFFYDTEMSDISVNTDPNGNISATGINALGQYAAYYTTNANASVFAYSNVTGSPNLLETTTTISSTTGINDVGDITGRISADGSTDHAFLFRNGIMTDLGTLGGNYSYGNAINNRGEVVGFAVFNNNVNHAFAYTAGHMLDLGTFGGSGSEATAINDKGQIAGTFHDPAHGDHRHAFFYSNGVLTNLGTLGGPDSDAAGINNRGEVVGFSYKTTYTGSPFVTKNGVMTDLNALILPDSPLTLISADAINDYGQIVGQGVTTLGNAYRAFLLTPIQPQLGVKGIVASAKSAGYIHLFWTATPGAKLYTIYRSDTVNGAQTNLGNVTGPSYDDKLVQAGKSYYYAVVATNLSGAKLISDKIPAINAATPSAPRVTAIAISTTQVNLTWQPAVGATNYTIYRSTEQGTGRVIVGTTTSTTSFSDKNLKPGTYYFYVVVAGNNHGWTKSVEVQVYTFDNKPSIPSLIANAISKSQIELDWTLSKNATGYTIYRSTTPGGPGRVIVGQTSNQSFRDTNLHASTRYYYVVVAGNQYGYTKSDEVSAVTPAQ